MSQDRPTLPSLQSDRPPATHVNGILLPGWDCPNCQAFNGTLKVDLQLCRCCDTPRPTATPEDSHV